VREIAGVAVTAEPKRTPKAIRQPGPRRAASDGPLRQRALLGLAGEFIAANTAARQQELRLELPLLEALLLRRTSGGPAPPPGPAVAAAAPYSGPGYGYGPGPSPDTVIVTVTGRWCRTEPNGFQWCWTP
jgi:hypothetical protein